MASGSSVLSVICSSSTGEVVVTVETDSVISSESSVLISGFTIMKLKVKNLKKIYMHIFKIQKITAMVKKL